MREILEGGRENVRNEERKRRREKEGEKGREKEIEKGEGEGRRGVEGAPTAS